MVRRHLKSLATFAAVSVTGVVCWWGVSALTTAQQETPTVSVQGAESMERIVATVGDLIVPPIPDVVSVSLARLDGPTPPPPRPTAAGMPSSTLTPGSYEIVFVAANGSTASVILELLPR